MNRLVVVSNRVGSLLGTTCAGEYVAAQDPADPGVLVLSRVAGSARQMEAALIVNPHDFASVAEAVQAARHMPIDERRERHAGLMRGLTENDVAHWSEDFLPTFEALAPPARRRHAVPGTLGTARPAL